MTKQAPDRNLAMELVRTTEAAALAAAEWVGRGDKEAADGAAVDAMRLILGTVQMTGTVIIGEGEKDEAPMLYNGEVVGDGSDPRVDIAVDPIDGTTLTSKGRGGAVAVIAVSEQGTMFDPGPCVYMEKIAVGPEAAGVVDIRAIGRREPARRGHGQGHRRPRGHRHDPRPPPPRRSVAEIRAAGSRIRLIGDGDVAGAIATAIPESGVDILFGIGGTPEGVIAAAALKCMGGELVGRLWPRDEDERAAAVAAGYDLDRVLGTDDLVAGDNCFFAATGITDGNLLKGVHYDRAGRHHAVAGDALPLRHRAPRRCPAPPREARRLIAHPEVRRLRTSRPPSSAGGRARRAPHRSGPRSPARRG